MAAQEAGFQDDGTDCDGKYVGQNDLKKLHDAHFNVGLREGIAAGTQSTLQDGFNCGYKEAFFKSLEFGNMRGVLSALSSYVNLESTQQNIVNDKYRDRINKLLNKLGKIEEHHLKETYDASCTNESIAETWAGDGVIQQQDVNDSQEFKELLVQCKHLCDELGLDPNITVISSQMKYIQ